MIQPEKKFYTKVEKPIKEEKKEKSKLRIFIYVFISIVLVTLLFIILYLLNIFFDKYRFKFQQPIIIQSFVVIEQRKAKVVYITPIPTKKNIPTPTVIQTFYYGK